MNKKKIGLIIEISIFILVLGTITFLYYFTNNKNDIEETSEVNILKITDENFQEEVLNSKVPVILEFSSNMCPPCLTMVPTLINTSDDNTKKTSEEYNINATPTIMVFKDGAIIETFIGATSEEKIMSVIKLED